MALLIDGYNLLHESGVFPPRGGLGSLERSRNALLNFLTSSLDAAQLRGAVIVFDAGDAPPGLPHLVDHRGLTVRYAAGYPDADTLLEELIRAASAPRRLTVVSSDHRVQRAARRRKAIAVDSDAWCAELARQKRGDHVSPAEPAKPQAPLSPDEVRKWVKEFSIAADEDIGAGQSPANSEPPPSVKSDQPELDDLANPFPPGYAEDLLDESGESDAEK